jgi:hypothetical protein
MLTDKGVICNYTGPATDFNKKLPSKSRLLQRQKLGKTPNVKLGAFGLGGIGNESPCRRLLNEEDLGRHAGGCGG